MPRTALRYAIEKMDAAERAVWMKKIIDIAGNNIKTKVSKETKVFYSKGFNIIKNFCFF